MNIIKISAVLTAALLTGALSATAFAAETLTTTTGSITFRKAIDVTNAAGAGGITGTIAFDVTAADESDLPDDGEKNYVGSVDQLDGSDIIATFAADDSGIANKESDVSVGFDTSKFEAPGIYYYHLTERDPGIHGLAATTATYLLKVRVVNDNTSDPDGATFKIDYATLTSLNDNTKSDLITNTYTTHGLTVTKALAGDWADYTDHFIFTLEITDADGKTITATVNSDEKTLGAALSKLNVIQGENGLYTTVNGVTYDYNADHAYWAFYVNGEYAQVGMDDTEIVDGAVYKLEVEKSE